MKLYICWGLFPSPRPGGHPCKNAHEALREAGHDPEVVKSYGLALLPDALNRTQGRREAKRLTGKTTVPVLVTDDGDAIWDSRNIVAWAREHPAGGGSPAGAS
jgi:glutaredoxin